MKIIPANTSEGKNIKSTISFCIKKESDFDPRIITIGGEEQSLSHLCNTLTSLILCKLERLDLAIENCYLIEDEGDIRGSCERAINIGSDLVVIFKLAKGDEDSVNTYVFNDNPLGEILVKMINERFVCNELITIKETLKKIMIKDSGPTVICVHIMCGNYIMKIFNDEDAVDNLLEEFINNMVYGIQEGYLEQKGSNQDA